MKFSTSVVLVFILAFSRTKAQDNLKSFDFKKGEVLDIILLSQTENPTELFDRYKQTAFPVAFEYTYRPQPTFGISKLTLGTNTPQLFLFGKWESIEKREGFLANISKRVPDFHQQRRDLFPYFGLTYYEMTKDLSFSVDSTKYNVVTSLWHKPTKRDASFVAKWKADVIQSGGKVIVELTDGRSPIGYDYNPDALLLVAWENEAAFASFAKQHPLATYGGLKNIHQFVIQ